MTLRDFIPRMWKAHELYGDYWFNSEPVPVAALHGSVMLISFWDYACGSSLRALEYVKEWHQKYSTKGLVVVGVHAPKFPFGKDPGNVQRALKRYGVEFPVVMDNGLLIWSNYQNRTWPAQCLVDKEGFIRYQNNGEGSYLATERVVQALLLDANPRVDLPGLMGPLYPSDRPGAVCYRTTPELFAGYLRGSIGNVEGYTPESLVHYDDPEIYMENRFYVDGDWLNGREYLSLPAESRSSGQIILPYAAIEVQGVLQPGGEQAVEIIIRQDDRYLDATNKGDEVLINGGGRSILVVDRPRVYTLVKNREHGEHVLKVSVPRSGLVLYSFTFMSGVIPELIANN